MVTTLSLTTYLFLSNVFINHFDKHKMRIIFEKKLNKMKYEESAIVLKSYRVALIFSQSWRSHSLEVSATDDPRWAAMKLTIKVCCV